MFLILNTIIDFLRTVGMGIIEIVYQLIVYVYNIFMYVSRVNLLAGENNIAGELYERVEIILAVVMVFYVTFEFIKYIVNPDTFEDKEKGGAGLLKRVLIVIVLLGFTPKIFEISYILQNRIFDSNTIPKIVVGKEYTTESIDNQGGNFASNLLRAFYSENKKVPASGTKDKYFCDEEDDSNHRPKNVVKKNLENLSKGDASTLSYCLNDRYKEDGEQVYLIEFTLFNFFIATLLGIFVLIVLCIYCFEAGKIVVQFAFLQIIAPIPIISYLAPGKDGMFNKWVRQCVTTYLDIFIRLFLLYLVMLISNLVTGLLSKLVDGENLNLFTGFDNIKPEFVKVLVILIILVGLWFFALKAPSLIKELLPSNKNAASSDYMQPFVRSAAATRTGASFAGHNLARVGAKGARALGKGALGLGKNAARGFGNAMKGIGNAIEKNRNGISYGEQFEQSMQQRKKAREEKKQEKDAAKQQVEQTRNAAKAAEAARKSAVGKLLDEKAKLQNLEKDQARWRELADKQARGTLTDPDEKNEFMRLNNSLEYRKSRIKGFKENISKLEQKVNGMGSEEVARLKNGARQLTELYVAQSKYEEMQNEYEKAQTAYNNATPEQRKDAGDALKNAETNLKNAETKLREANKAYNKETVGSLIDAKERQASAQKEIDRIVGSDPNFQEAYKQRQAIAERYNGMSETEKSSEAGRNIKSTLDMFDEYDRRVAERDSGKADVEKISKDIAEIGTKSLSSERLKTKVAEAEKAVEAAIAKNTETPGTLDPVLKGAGTVLQGLGTVAKDTLSVGTDFVKGTYVGSKTTDASKFNEDYKKNLAEYVAKVEAKEEYVAKYGEPTIVETASNYVQTKYNQFAESHALPTINGVKTQIVQKEFENTQVSETSKAMQSVVTELGNADKVAQEFNKKKGNLVQVSSDVKYGANDKYAITVDEVAGITGKTRTDVTVADVLRVGQARIDGLSTQISNNTELRADLEKRRIACTDVVEKDKYAMQIEAIDKENTRLSLQKQELEGAQGDLEKKMGRLTLSLSPDEKVAAGITDAGVLNAEDAIKTFIKSIKGNKEQMRLISEFDARFYDELNMFNVEYASVKSLYDMKDALELVIAKMNSSASERQAEIDRLKKQQEARDAQEKLFASGSSGGGSSSGGKK